MKSSLSLCLVVIAASAVAIAQESSCPAGTSRVSTAYGSSCEANFPDTPWRDGKPMSPVDRLTHAAGNSPQTPGEIKPSQVPNEIQNYAPYSIALMPDRPGAEVVLPFLTTENKIAFLRVSHVVQASNENKLLGRPISYGEVIALIGELQIEVNRLKQENEKLWAVVAKSSPPQTIVVQTPPAPAPAQQPSNDRLMKYLLLRQLFPSPQPYALQPLPQPVAPRSNSLNCTTQYVGATAYTNCQKN